MAMSRSIPPTMANGGVLPPPAGGTTPPAPSLPRHPWAHGGDDLGSLRTRPVGAAPSSPAALSLFAQLRPRCPNPNAYPGHPPRGPFRPRDGTWPVPGVGWSSSSLPSPLVPPQHTGREHPGTDATPPWSQGAWDASSLTSSMLCFSSKQAGPPLRTGRGGGIGTFWEWDELVNSILASHGSPGRETPGRKEWGDGGSGAGGRGLDGCWVLWAPRRWGHGGCISAPAAAGGRAGSEGRVGGWQEREGAANGKNWRKRLFTPRSIPGEGQGRARRRQTLTAPSAGGGSLPPTLPSIPVHIQKGMKAPNWEPGRWPLLGPAGSPVPG